MLAGNLVRMVHEDGARNPGVGDAVEEAFSASTHAIAGGWRQLNT